MKKATLGDFRDVEITKLEHSALCEEQVGTLDIPMHNLKFVQCFKTTGHLNEVPPDLLLWHERPPLFVLVYFGLQIACICQVHDYAECRRSVLEEGLLVGDDVRVPITGNKKMLILDGGEYSNLV